MTNGIAADGTGAVSGRHDPMVGSELSRMTRLRAQGTARRYALLLGLAMMPVILLVLVLAVVQFRSQRESLLQDLSRRAGERHLALAGLLGQAVDHVTRLRHQAEDELSGSLPPSPSPLRAHLAPGAGGVFLDAAADAPWRARSGNVIGVPDLLARRAADPRELDMGLGLMPAMRFAHLATPFLRWSYYFSAERDFIAIYPYAPSREILDGMPGLSVQAVIDAWLGYDIFRAGTPERDPGRRGYWTRLYRDAAGTGWMVSRGAPVYAGDRFHGVVGTDILLEVLDRFLAEHPLPLGHSWLVDDDGAVLASDTAGGDGAARGDAGEVRRLADQLPAGLAGPVLDRLRTGSDGIVRENGHYLLAQRMAEAPWTVLTVVPRAAVDAQILPDFRPYAIILAALLLMLVLGQWLLQRLLVAPALALGDHVRVLAEGGTPPAPALPAVWKPLIDAVDGAFAARQEVLKLNARFVAATESIPDGFALFDAEDRLTYHNSRYPGHLMPVLSRTLAIGKRFQDWIAEGARQGPIYHPEMGEGFAQARIRLRDADGDQRAREHEHRLADGRWMRLRESRMAEGGRVLLTTDITARKQAEQALASSEARFIAAAGALPDGLAIFDADGRLAYFNERFPLHLMPPMRQVLALGRRLDEMLAEALAIGPIYHADMGAGFLERRLAMRGQPQSDHEQHLADGRWMRLRESRMSDGGLVLLTTDITRRKAEREALEEQTRKLEAVLAHIAEGVNIVDGDGRVVLVNRGFLEIYGFPAELGRPGTPLADFVRDRIRRGDLRPDEEASDAPVEAKVQRRVAAYLAQPSTTLEEDRPDGRLIRVHRQRLPDGLLISTYSDITELRRRERELAVLARALEQAGDSVEITTADYRLTFVNPAFTRLTGWRPDEALGHTPAELLRSDRHGPAFFEEIDRKTRAGEIWSGRMTSRHKDGHLIDQDAVISPIFDEQGRLTHFVCVKRDVTESERAAAALRASEARYRAVVEGQTEFVLRQLPDGRISFANEAYCRYLGIDRDELLSGEFNAFALLSEADLVRVLEHIQRLTPERPTETIDIEARHPDGTPHIEQWIDTGIFDAAGRLVELQAVGRDVTTQRLAERALQASEARYRAVVEGQSEFILRLLPDGILTFVNDAYCRYRGLPRELLLARFDDVDHYPPSEQAVIRDAWAGLVPTAPTVAYTLRHDHGDGRQRYEHWVDTGIFDAAGALVEIQSVGRDITEQRLAEEALRASEARYRAVVETQTEWIIRVDSSGQTLFVNDAYCRYMGMSREALLAPDWDDLALLTPAERRRYEATRATLTPSNPFTTIEVEATLPDGSRHVEQWMEHAIFDSEGRVVERQAVGRDITEQRRAEAALQASEARYRAVLEDQTELIGRFDAEFRCIYSNPANARIYGKTQEEVLGGDFFDTVPERIKAELRARLEALTPNDPVDYGENEKLLPDGRERWFSWTNRALFDAEGRLTGYQAVGRDITPQKQAEQALRDSEARLAQFMQNAPVGMYVKDLDGRYVMANPEMAKVFGRPVSEVLGRSIEAVLPADEAAMVRAFDRQLILEGRPTIQEEFLEGLDAYAWSMVIRFPIRDSEGRIVQIGGFDVDITRQKQVEAQLKESEAQLRLIAEGIPVTVLITRFDTPEVLFANARYAETFGSYEGRQAESILGSWERIEDRALLFAGVQREGRVDGFETELRRQDGSRFAALISARATSYDGRAAMLMAVTDISDQRRMEQQVRESEARLAAFLQNAPVAMYLEDLQGRYVMANPEMAKVLGRPVEEVLGHAVRAERTLDGGGEDLTAAAVLRTGKPLVTEEHAPGLAAYRWSMVIRFPIRGQGGAITHIGGFHVDTSGQKLAEAEITRQREALHQSEKMSALGSLLAGVAHELNNPLSVVVGYSAMLEELAPDEASRKRAERVHAAAARCARIVKTFLAMARQKPPQRGPVVILRVVEAALELAAYGLRTTGIKVESAIEPDLPPVWGDADQLHQVLANLLVNAQHALEQRRQDRHLWLRARRAGERVELLVEDNGPGVPAEIRQRIFEPFFTTKPQGVGTGVGLSLCHGIVTAHDGTIGVEDRPGGGARFRILLPLAADRGETAAALLPQPDKARHAGRVLVVDDEPEIAELVALSLGRDGIEVVTAANGRQALARLEAERFDFIVSDLRMPDLDGPGLWQELRQHHPALCERILFVTGDTLGVEVNRFLRETAVPVMEKPLELDKLRRHVRERLLEAKPTG